MKIRAKAKGAACALSLLTLLALPAAAQAASGPAPAPRWKLIALAAPTNLPPEQSAVQRIAVEAEGGTFTIARRLGEGGGTPVTKNGLLTVEKGSDEATIFSGEYEVGARITSSGVFPAETTVRSCDPDCTTKGSTVTLSNAAEAPASGTASKIVKIFTKAISGATGPLHPGDELVAADLAPGTLVEAVLAGGEVTVSQPPPAEYTGGSITFVVNEPTRPLPYDATAAEVQDALDALPAFASGTFAVSGGPGGDAGHPYFVTFGGELADEEVEPFVAGTRDLGGEHAFIHVVTTVPGGAGTGEIVLMPANVGGLPTAGRATGTIGPLPAGLRFAGPASGEEWVCPEGTPVDTVTCTSARSVPATHSSGKVLRVPVEVQGGVGSRGSLPVEISGAGAGSDSYQVPIVVSNEPAPFGAAAFWAGSFEADGTPSTQAGAHPFSSAAYFMLTTVRSAAGAIEPTADSKNVIVDLPPGFTGNPMVTARCPQSMVVEPTGGAPGVCDQEMAVGTLVPIVGGLNAGSEWETQLFNDVPPNGYAAEFSAKIAYPVQSVLASVRAEDDFGVRITAPNNPTYLKIMGAFTAFRGAPPAAHGKAVLTNPIDCAESIRQAPVVVGKANSWQDPASYFEASILPQPVLTGCDKLHIHPSFSFQPTTTQGSSPIGAVAHLHFPQQGLTDAAALAEPSLKRTVVKLPAGLTLNPSQANGLEACSEAQIGYKGAGALPNPTRFDEDPVTCPDGSKLGTVSVTSPLLDQPLGGTVYLARQDENPFHTLIGLYLVLESERFGLRFKLPGKVVPNPVSGQLTATFDYLPQQPFEDMTLNFRGGGPRSELATPEVCGTYSTDGEWEPWSAPESGPPAKTADSFTVTQNCAASAATRRFAPSFEAGTTSPLAGAYTPLVIKVGRQDGEGELRSLDFTLPPGVTGKLAGIPYCSDAQIAAAAAKTGRQEQAAASCPAASELGHVDAAAGVGSEPFHVGGHAYLAGPYKGAPLSSVVITPAVAGPFDLGDVVIRAPIYVNPETAALTVKSDPIPTILKGIPLKMRSVTIAIDRSQFGLNPTNCEVMSATASIGSSDGARATPSNRFQVGGCDALPFKPKLKIKVIGKTKRNAKPRLKAVLTAKPGEANIARAQVNLPHSEFLEQNHIRTVCTRVQFAAGDGNGSACPPGSVYGKVKAWTPLLDNPLEGKVYLRSNGGERKLPDVVAALDGQVNIALWGKVDSGRNHGIRNTFEVVPDAPVSRFVLEMNGGKKGLLVNSENLCSRKAHRRAIVRLVGQNGKVHAFKPLVENQCKKKHKKAKKSKHHSRDKRAKK